MNSPRLHTGIPLLRHATLSVVAFLVALLFTSPFCQAAQADDAERPIVVAVLNYPLFLQRGEDGHLSGYAYEYLERIRKITGWHYEYRPMSPIRALEELRAGRVDIIPGGQRIPERLDEVQFSQRSMGESTTVLCTLPGVKDYSFNNFEQFNGMRIAYLKGSALTSQLQETFRSHGTTPVLIEYETDASSKQALLRREVDAVLMSSVRCEAGYNIIARINVVPLYLMLNKQREQLKEALDAAQETIVLEDPYYLLKLDKKYYGDLLRQLSLTQQEKDYIRKGRPLLVSLTADMKPESSINPKTGEFEGIIPDLFDLISKATGLEFRFVKRGDTDTLYQDIQEKRIDIIAPVADDAWAASTLGVNLSNTFYSSSIALVTNSSVSDYHMKECRTILKEGRPLYSHIAENLGYENIRYSQSLEGCMKAVNDGDADVTLIPSYSLARMLDHAYYKNVGTTSLPVSDYNFAIGVAASADPHLLSILNKAIASITPEMRTDIIIRQLQNNTDPYTFKEMLSRHLAEVLLTICFIICVIAFFMHRASSAVEQTNRKLVMAMAKAEEASLAKTEFLSRMSHDMRTPMNAIIGMSTLGQGETGDPRCAEYFKHILMSANFLLGLINDILDMAKIENGALILYPEPYALQDFAEQLNSTIRPLCDARHIAFVLSNECPAIPRIVVDKLRFNQIFFNLLSNAVKFTPEGGTVTCILQSSSVTDEKGSFHFIVRDTGIGMSPEFMRHMFDPFSQEHGGLRDQTKGTGLGLSIVKRLVESMRGTLSITSELNRGTECIITMEAPISQYPVQETSAGAPIDPVLSGKHILLCEDHPLNAQIARTLLERQGAVLTLATNGQDGLDQFRNSAPFTFDLILMDIRMPVMDGLEATRLIRELNRPDAAGIPIVAMTANAYEEDIRLSREAGMNAHLAKPILPARLYAELHRLLTAQPEC